MRISYLLMIWFGLVSLGGCANPNLEERKAVQAVCDAALDTPERQAFRQVMPEKVDQITVEMMTDPRKLSPEQKQLMMEDDKEVDLCNERVRAYVQKYYPPSTMPIHEAYWRGMKLLRVEATQTDMTIGSINQAKVRLYQEYATALLADKRSRELYYINSMRR